MIAESQPGQGNEARPFYDFLESCLRHKSEIVIFEAARAICNMRCAGRGQGGCAWLCSQQWQSWWLTGGVAFAGGLLHVLPPALTAAGYPNPPRRDVTTRELTPAVTVLQLFLSSSKPVLRFAAVRTLNKVGAARGSWAGCWRLQGCLLHGCSWEHG